MIKKWSVHFPFVCELYLSAVIFMAKSIWCAFLRLLHCKCSYALMCMNIVHTQLWLCAFLMGMPIQCKVHSNNQSICSLDFGVRSNKTDTSMRIHWILWHARSCIHILTFIVFHTLFNSLAKVSTEAAAAAMLGEKIIKHILTIVIIYQILLPKRIHGMKKEEEEWKKLFACKTHIDK